MRPQGGGKEATTTRYRKWKRVGHPLAHADGQVYVHRAVLFDKIGWGTHQCHWCSRELEWNVRGARTLVVDHLDGDEWNNDPVNLAPSCRYCNLSRVSRTDWLTHCEAGHQWTEENTYWRPDGGRQCRKCNQIREKARARTRYA